jgi:hypothetical protein
MTSHQGSEGWLSGRVLGNSSVRVHGWHLPPVLVVREKCIAQSSGPI